MLEYVHLDLRAAPTTTSPNWIAGANTGPTSISRMSQGGAKAAKLLTKDEARRIGEHRNRE